MILAVFIILLVIGSVLFHFLSPWYLTPLASNWGTIDTTLDITFVVTGFVFVAVNLFMAYAIIKFRYNKNRKAEYEPENKKLEWILTGITSVGVAAMLAPGLFVWADFVTPPDDAVEVEAIGQQWHWSYRLPGPDGVLGAVESRYVSNENPFGMERDDPFGQDDLLISSPELHLPIDQPVKLLLRSKDVLHNFAVAQFRVKMDLVPGLVSYLWFTPTKTGNFEILCEELCGVGHHTMRGMVVVDTAEDYQKWLDEQTSYAEQLALDEAGNDLALGQASYAVCSACHGADGMGNTVLNAPKIAGQEAWYVERQLAYYKSGVRGAHPEDTFGQTMAPMMATLADDQAIRNVAAYVESMSGAPAPKTITGDVERGAELYRTCAVCHGQNGEGIQAANAPRAAGMSDWYLARQLEYFKTGVRGAHEDDMYGMQMNMMARMLKDDNAINDVVAYMNTLEAPTNAEN